MIEKESLADWLATHASHENESFCSQHIDRFIDTANYPTLTADSVAGQRYYEALFVYALDVVTRNPPARWNRLLLEISLPYTATLPFWSESNWARDPAAPRPPEIFLMDTPLAAFFDREQYQTPIATAGGRSGISALYSVHRMDEPWGENDDLWYSRVIFLMADIPRVPASEGERL